MAPFLIGLVVVVVLIAVFAIGLYNNLVRSRNQVKNAFAQIDVQLLCVEVVGTEAAQVQPIGDGVAQGSLDGRMLVDRFRHAGRRG